MAQFQDAGGREWGIAFDAFLLNDVRKEADIDLADIAAGGWLKVETDSAALGQVVAILCRDEIKQRGLTPREFIKLMRGKTIEAARKALTDEGADFFPQSEWSAIRSNCSTRKEAKTQANQAEIMLDVVAKMPAEIQMKLLDMFATGVASMSSDDSQPENQSVSGPADTRSKNATREPESAELTAVG